MEIVGPQHLATFLRTALICSNIYFPMRWTYHVTELLPTGSPIPHRAAPPHANEAPPTFISPAVDGTYSVLEDHTGVTVCAATLNHPHRGFCLAYTLIEPHGLDK